ncbi:MAG: hypothetical protein AAGH64_10415 [Planctomycetota bacterium]
MHAVRAFVAPAALISVGVCQASASIVSISGGGMVLDPAPADFPLPNQVQSTVVQGINEVQGLVLGGTLEIDDLADIIGTVTLEPGTEVNSHLIAFDPAGSRQVNGIEVVFDTPVLAVIIDDQRLFDTQAIFGLESLNYPANTVFAYGFEGSESFTVSGDTVTFSSSASNPGDYFRVLTAIPTPGAGALLIVAGAGALRRRRA